VLMDSVKQYRAKFEQLNSRERGLVLLVALVLIYGLWSISLGSLQDAGQRKLHTQLSQLELDLQAQTQQLTELQARQGIDPDAELRRQLAQTKLDIQRIDNQLSGLSVGLIPAQELAKVLEGVLVQSKSLKLLSLETLPIKQLELQDASVENNADMVTGVFKHSVRVKLEGNYFAIAQYLTALENLPWRFYWASLHYQVQRYPNAVTELEVYTLSTERGNLGV
jgi:MSHA biogenesis protein MshJ